MKPCTRRPLVSRLHAGRFADYGPFFSKCSTSIKVLLVGCVLVTSTAPVGGELSRQIKLCQLGVGALEIITSVGKPTIFRPTRQARQAVLQHLLQLCGVNGHVLPTRRASQHKKITRDWWHLVLLTRRHFQPHAICQGVKNVPSDDAKVEWIGLLSKSCNLAKCTNLCISNKCLQLSPVSADS